MFKEFSYNQLQLNEILNIAIIYLINIYRKYLYYIYIKKLDMPTFYIPITLAAIRCTKSGGRKRHTTRTAGNIFIYFGLNQNILLNKIRKSN